jgi:hypothetical protein
MQRIFLCLETYVFGSPAYDEEVVSNTDQKQPIFDEYPSEDDEEQIFSWLLWNLVAWFLYMIIMNLILGRAMKEKRKS